MRVTLMRHGEASFDAPSDSQRPLTEQGWAQSKELLNQVLTDDRVPDCIWVSPLLRAQQTAGIAADRLNLSLIEKTFLVPEGSPQKVLRALSSAVDVEHLLIVAHQPLLGSLYSLLCHGNLYESHPFVTSEIVTLSCELPEAELFEQVSNRKP